MVEILRSRDQTGPLWWRFSSAIVALYSLLLISKGNESLISKAIKESISFEIQFLSKEHYLLGRLII